MQFKGCNEWKEIKKKMELTAHRHVRGLFWLIQRSEMGSEVACQLLLLLLIFIFGFWALRLRDQERKQGMIGFSRCSRCSFSFLRLDNRDMVRW
jgi:hypothetical protein